VTGQTTGLRALKKRRTRENISHQATRLFQERGFDHVTIAEIAAAARVAKMTVTNYFPRKEDLALDLRDAFVGGPVTTLRERRPGESALAALRRSHLAAVAARDPVVGFTGPEFAHMITGSPALVARLREFHDDRERALARVLAEETGAAPDDILPRVAAAQLGGVLRLLLDEMLRLTLDGHADDEIAGIVAVHVHTAFTAVEPSLSDYAIRPGHWREVEAVRP
jgi:AcrR family transcriptional regulator